MLRPLALVPILILLGALALPVPAVAAPRLPEMATQAAPGVDPSVVNVTLLPGQSTTVAKRVTTPEIPPNPDIILLADTTASMFGALQNVQDNLPGIIRSVTGKTENVRFGVASYKDEQDGSDAIFHFDAPLTDTPRGPDVPQAITDGIGSWNASGGFDDPESAINALWQVARGGHFTYRPNDTKIIVWFGDNPSHDPSPHINGHTKAEVIGVLQTDNIGVVGVNLVDPDPDNHRPGINGAATGTADGSFEGTPGSVPVSIPAGQAADIVGPDSPLLTAADNTVANAIIKGIGQVKATVTHRVSDCDPRLSVSNTPPSSQPVDSGATVNFTETITVANGTPPGTYRCTVNYLINGGSSDDFAERIMVTVPNQPPRVSAGGPYSGNEDNDVAIFGTVSDPDASVVSTTWSITPTGDVPPGSSCTFGNPAALSTTVNCSERGTYRLTLTADDHVNPPVASSTTLTLKNVPPTVSAGGPYSGFEDNNIAIAGTVTDPDGPNVTTTWSIAAVEGVPPGFRCDFGNVNALSTTVNCTERGTYRLTLTADDHANPPVSDSTTLTLKNVPPTVSAGGPYSGNEDIAVPIAGTVTDPDDAQFTFRWSINPADNCTFADAAALSTTVTCTERGDYVLTLTVNDGKNPPVTATTTLRLLNQAPKVSAGGPYAGQDNIPVPIKATVVDPDSPGRTTTWTFVPVTGVDPGATCAFGNPQELATFITCTSPGIYTLILTVDDKVNPPVVARTTLTLGLRPGALSLATFVNPTPGFVGGDPVVVTFTVRNGGVSPMKSVRLTTTLPPGLAQPVTSPAGCASTCVLGTLVPGQTVQVTLTFAVNVPLDQTLSAVLTTEGPDIDQSDNSARARITILQPTLTVDPTIGPQGFVTRAVGRNFPAGARVALKWSIGISDNPGEVTVGPDGTIDTQVLIFPKDARGLRVLSATPVTGPKFGAVPANPFLVVSRALKPKTFIIR